jgi:hypothetical protein
VVYLNNGSDDGGSISSFCQESLSTLLTKADEGLTLLDRLVSMVSTTTADRASARRQDHEYITKLIAGKEERYHLCC